MNSASIPKVIEAVSGRVTKVTVPTRYRDSFSRYLSKRKFKLEPPYHTDIWNGIESAYTFFELPVPYEVTDLVFDDWIDELTRCNIQ